MNEMKPEDAMKVLECCGIDRCDDCPCYTEELGCDLDLQLLALALLREKDEMLEATIAGQETLQTYLAEKDAETERLMNNIFDVTDYAVDKIKAARAEAITEFAQRLKKHFDSDCVHLRNTNGYIRSVADQIAKEMKETPMDLTAHVEQMRSAIKAYTERHGEEPNVLYMTARLMARIEAWVLRDGFVRGSYGYLSGFGMVPPGKVGWFYGLGVKLLDGEGLRWAVAREHVINAECEMQNAELLKGEGESDGKE